MPYCLKVLSSPSSGRDGEKILLPEGECIAGRAAPPARLELQGSKVSKKHCVFRSTRSMLQVEDLNSANGLFVNGAKTKVAALKDKDRVVIGEFILEVLVVKS